MISATIEFPLNDQYTTYDYDIGINRRLSVEKKNTPLNIWMKLSNVYVVLVPKLRITYHKNETVINDEVNAFTRQKTIEFANSAIMKWGNDAEKVLSASKTGALYWNIIHHFGDYSIFLKNV